MPARAAGCRNWDCACTVRTPCDKSPLVSPLGQSRDPCLFPPTASTVPGTGEEAALCCTTIPSRSIRGRSAQAFGRQESPPVSVVCARACTQWHQHAPRSLGDGSLECTRCCSAPTHQRQPFDRTETSGMGASSDQGIALPRSPRNDGQMQKKKRQLCLPKTGIFVLRPVEKSIFSPWRFFSVVSGWISPLVRLVRCAVRLGSDSQQQQQRAGIGLQIAFY